MSHRTCSKRQQSPRRTRRHLVASPVASSPASPTSRRARVTPGAMRARRAPPCLAAPRPPVAPTRARCSTTASHPRVAHRGNSPRGNDTPLLTRESVGSTASPGRRTGAGDLLQRTPPLEARDGESASHGCSRARGPGKGRPRIRGRMGARNERASGRLTRGRTFPGPPARRSRQFAKRLPQLPATQPAAELSKDSASRSSCPPPPPTARCKR